MNVEFLPEEVKLNSLEMLNRNCHQDLDVLMPLDG